MRGQVAVRVVVVIVVVLEGDGGLVALLLLGLRADSLLLGAFIV